ncbi:MAG: helix-turn-helix domain-containing protein [Actinomycetota bacterium]|nr:helix-turn-helix domain-containing protein [Actinomycetota bacterium]
MTHPAYLREKAREIRVEKRLTIDEIAERLALPRTTIYHWVRDIPIPRATWPPDAQRLGTLAMQARYRELREAAYAQGIVEFDSLAEDRSFRDFVCLYIAEGYKRSRNSLAIGNSDPAVIAVADRWLRRLAGREPGYTVQYHADQDLEELRAFWGGVVGVAPERVRVQRKSNSNQLKARTWRSVHGPHGSDVRHAAPRADASVDRPDAVGVGLDSARLGA